MGLLGNAEAEGGSRSVLLRRVTKPCSPCGRYLLRFFLQLGRLRAEKDARREAQQQEEQRLFLKQQHGEHQGASHLGRWGL